MKFYFLFILAFPLCSKAQFTDSVTQLAKIISGGFINKTKDGANYLFNNNLQYSVKKKRVVLNAAAGWLYGMSPDKLTNNDFVLSSNVNLYRHFTGFYYWGLVNYTTSYSLNIKSQGQAGLGIAYNFLDRKNIWLNLSNGIIGELSRIIQNDSNIVNYQTVRNSLRAQFMLKMGEKATFKAGGFYQPSFKDIRDHIISSDTEFSYALWKGLNFNARMQYNKISRTEKENLIFTYGFGYQKYF